MNPTEMALFSRVFHLPAGIMITSVHPSASELVMDVACQAPSMPCPECHQPSARIHGHYQRTVADLPCVGRNVILALTVRKFVCPTPSCPRQIFTERLPGLVESYARMTSRLIALVQALGVAVGGQMGTRLADRAAIATTAPTLFRHLMQLPSPVARAVQALGVDDFAWKKRHRSGTLLVDLERHQIVDVLADRESATVAQWLRAHPGVKVVSRDRGKEYAKAAREGAPQAQQVVDRFHLVRNLAEVLEKILGHCRAEIRQADAVESPGQKAGEEGAHPLPTPATWQQRTPAHVERAHQARQASRDDRFRQILELRRQGLTQAAIAKRIGMSERAVRNWLKRGAAPTGKRQFRRRSVAGSLRAVCVAALASWGSRGQRALRRNPCARLPRKRAHRAARMSQALAQEPASTPLPQASAADRFSANKMTWLFIRDPKRLTTQEQAELELVCQRSATAQQTYQLTQQFMSMLRLRHGQEFEQWVQAVEMSQIPELESFTHSLLKDKDAVVAGLTLSYSNGPVEAQVQKLKVLKRSMFGRAKLPLLRQRLLHAV